MGSASSNVAAAARSRPRDDRHRTTWGNRARFLGRTLGLLALVGLVMSGLSLADVLTSADPLTALVPLLSTAEPPTILNVSAKIFAVCAVIVLIFLFLEIVTGLIQVAFGKTLLGLNTVLQIGLSVAVLALVNLWSQREYRRWDLTADQRFTLPAELVADLQRLRADQPTTVVVLRQSQSASNLNRLPDAYDRAAELKVVEKVNDLIAQLRQFGPQFQVVVLDRQETGFDLALRELTRRRPGLADAIRTAPENTIFFYADEKIQTRPRQETASLTAATGTRLAVQPDPDNPERSLVYPATIARLPFREFYQLDKTASREATPVERERAGTILGGLAYAPTSLGAGNLVLIPQGPEVFVRKLLTLEERRPVIGLAVIHPLLSSREAIEEYSCAGLRTALERHGFDVTDIILKKWTRTSPPTPTATTYEESELDRGEARYNLLSLAVAQLEGLIGQIQADVKTVDAAIQRANQANSTDAKRQALVQAAQVLQNYVRGRIQTESEVRQVFNDLKPKVAEFQAELTELQPRLLEAGEAYRQLLRDERTVESRRTTDVQEKLRAYVRDCDALIVPRLTVTDIVRGDVIPASLFHLSQDQARVIQEFIQAGKPVLFALGPVINDGRGPTEGPDEVEKLLPQFGILPSRQTILTDAEAAAIAERSGQEFGSTVRPTPLVFPVSPAGSFAPNPIGQAYQTTARAVDQQLDIRKGGYRPFDLAPGVLERSSFQPVIATTGPDSFNEDNPLPTDDAVPKFEPTKPEDPKRGTREEERRGPFLVGIALEAPIPVDWVRPAAANGSQGLSVVQQQALAGLAFPWDGGLSAALLSEALKPTPRPTVRLVVFGHGGLFTGKTLEPGPETLLIHSLNWQLRREERLPRNLPDEQKWRYPRADLSPEIARLWRQGLLLVLPAAVAVLGITVLMLRKVR